MNQAERNLKLMEEGFLPRLREDGSMSWHRGEDAFVMTAKDAAPDPEAVARVQAADAEAEMQRTKPEVKNRHER